MEYFTNYFNINFFVFLFNGINCFYISRSGVNKIQETISSSLNLSDEIEKNGDSLKTNEIQPPEYKETKNRGVRPTRGKTVKKDLGSQYINNTWFDEKYNYKKYNEITTPSKPPFDLYSPEYNYETITNKEPIWNRLKIIYGNMKSVLQNMDGEYTKDFDVVFERFDSIIDFGDQINIIKAIENSFDPELIQFLKYKWSTTKQLVIKDYPIFNYLSFNTSFKIPRVILFDIIKILGHYLHNQAFLHLKESDFIVNLMKMSGFRTDEIREIFRILEVPINEKSILNQQLKGETENLVVEGRGFSTKNRFNKKQARDYSMSGEPYESDMMEYLEDNMVYDDNYDYYNYNDVMEYGGKENKGNKGKGSKGSSYGKVPSESNKGGGGMYNDMPNEPSQATYGDGGDSRDYPLTGPSNSYGAPPSNSFGGAAPSNSYGAPPSNSPSKGNTQPSMYGQMQPQMVPPMMMMSSFDPFILLAGLGFATFAAYIIYRLLSSTMRRKRSLSNQDLLALDLSDIPVILNNLSNWVMKAQDLYENDAVRSYFYLFFAFY